MKGHGTKLDKKGSENAIAWSVALISESINRPNKERLRERIVTAIECP